VIQSLQITSQNNLASKFAKQNYFLKNSLFGSSLLIKSYVGTSAGMAACGERILENHDRNQWFKLSSCKLVMQVFVNELVLGSNSALPNGHPNKNGATKLYVG
jgi:hypothetical protein